MGELTFPTRDVEVREVCRKMLGISKSSSNRLTKEELVQICEQRGYITVSK